MQVASLAEARIVMERPPAVLAISDCVWPSANCASSPVSVTRKKPIRWLESSAIVPSRSLIRTNALFCAAPLGETSASAMPPSDCESVIVDPSTATSFSPATLPSQAGLFADTAALDGMSAVSPAIAAVQANVSATAPANQMFFIPILPRLRLRAMASVLAKRQQHKDAQQIFLRGRRGRCDDGAHGDAGHARVERIIARALRAVPVCVRRPQILRGRCLSQEQSCEKHPNRSCRHFAHPMPCYFDDAMMGAMAGKSIQSACKREATLRPLAKFEYDERMFSFARPARN